MKRTIYMAAAATVAALTIISCRWYNDEEMRPSPHPEKMFAKIVQSQLDKYMDTILDMVLLDRYLSLEGNEQEEFIKEYSYFATVLYNTATGQYTVKQNGREKLVAERIGEKPLFEGGGWRTSKGAELSHIEGNKLWFSDGTIDTQVEPAYAQQIECQFCNDDILISNGKKRPYVRVAFHGKGTTSYRDSNYEFQIKYTLDNPLEFKQSFEYNAERKVVSGKATILVTDKTGRINDMITAVYSDNDIVTEVLHLK